MADPAPTGTVVPAPQVGDGSTAPEFKVPEGKVLVDSSEHQNWQRQREQLAGLTRFQGAAAKLGIKNEGDFGKWGKLDSTLKQRGMSFDKLLAAFEEEGGTQQDIPQGLNPAELKKYLADFVKEQGFVSKSELESVQGKSVALIDHREGAGREKATIDKHLSSLPEGKRGMGARLFNSMLDEKRGVYPDGHPLAAEHLAPLDEKTVAAVWAETRKLMALDEGEELAAAAEAAARGKPSSPAGSPAAKKPDKNNTETGDDRRPGTPAFKARVQAEHDKKVAARSGKPVSSLGV